MPHQEESAPAVALTLLPVYGGCPRGHFPHCAAHQSPAHPPPPAPRVYPEAGSRRPDHAAQSTPPRPRPRPHRGGRGTLGRGLGPLPHRSLEPWGAESKLFRDLRLEASQVAPPFLSHPKTLLCLWDLFPPFSPITTLIRIIQSVRCPGRRARNLIVTSHTVQLKRSVWGVLLGGC